jgi:hypothetical protein
MREHWMRPGVAEDLQLVSVLEPFSVLSLYIGGPDELKPYAQGATLLSDDTMRLEFSAPRELHSRRAGENVATLTALLGPEAGPPAVREALGSAGPVQWHNRGAMMAKSDVHARAYDDFLRALEMDATDTPALGGFVRTAVLTGRSGEALVALRPLAAKREASARVMVALSKLLVASGATDEAVDAARQASRLSQ